MQRNGNLISGLISIALGLMLIIIKGEVISVALTVLGTAAIVMAVADFIKGFTASGIVKAVVGVCILVFGWLFINVALYLLAGAIIIMGLMQILEIHRSGIVFLTNGEKILAYLKPVLTVLAGILLLFNQGGVIDGVFIATGVLLIFEGILGLADQIKQ